MLENLSTMYAYDMVMWDLLGQVHEWRRRLRAEQGGGEAIRGEGLGRKKQQSLPLSGWKSNFTQ